MVDLCDLSPLNCLNNGKCFVNISVNTTYCQCDHCHEGLFCENNVWKQTSFDTDYVLLIICIIGLCFSILNNSLALELFIRCRGIRCTNCGIYLIVYSILSLISNILLLAYEAQVYYPNPLQNNPEEDQRFYCYVAKISYNMLVYVCIWFSACLAFERGLIIYFDDKMNDNRWRSIVVISVIFTIAGGSAAPMLWYKCNWDNIPSLQTARAVFNCFYIGAGITIYVLATLLILYSFTRRIHQYGVENKSFIKTYLKLLRSHLFIFIPPLAYIVGYTPYAILQSQRNSHTTSYYHCGISTAEYIVRVLIETLQGIPVVFTWLLFIYPSRVYMNDFYLNTWSGQWLFTILSAIKCNRRKESNQLSTISS